MKDSLIGSFKVIIKNKWRTVCDVSEVKASAVVLSVSFVTVGYSPPILCSLLLQLYFDHRIHLK